MTAHIVINYYVDFGLSEPKFLTLSSLDLLKLLSLTLDVLFLVLDRQVGNLAEIYCHLPFPLFGVVTGFRVDATVLRVFSLLTSLSN